MRIWVRIPNWIGDVVMSTPALRALRKTHPSAEIVLSGPGSISGLLKLNPNFDVFETWEDWSLLGVRRGVQEMRNGLFDCAVLFPDSIRAALLPYLAGVPNRIGYARDPFRRFMLTNALLPPEEDGHRVPIVMIDRYMRITRELGCSDLDDDTEIYVDPDAQDRIYSRLGIEGLTREKRYVLVAPGASFGASKLWPPANFASACDGLRSDHDLEVLLVPGPGEEDIAQEIQASMKYSAICVVNPVTKLDELVALVEGATLVLSNDTGPRHIAIATGTPVVCLMGPTDPRHTEYRLESQRVLREDVPCSPCGMKVCPIDHRCMTRITPDHVLSEVKQLLS